MSDVTVTTAMIAAGAVLVRGVVAATTPHPNGTSRVVAAETGVAMIALEIGVTRAMAVAAASLLHVPTGLGSGPPLPAPALATQSVDSSVALLTSGTDGMVASDFRVNLYPPQDHWDLPPQPVLDDELKLPQLARTLP
ncbi:hypothetical protein H310_11221 [Aphanomyces invadans]|uniref:Uncharacterized protein n=1 Tax=Aphanomyces invadans TaxID=157072 RepID=A0A024TMU9_9STRA|nr:hypothetical protein H310_11221 [Aphanomyces invadans]ETV95324.1 hypothetical protein H310_11221 [Aphanomyces invadans]|eukprot:XP_008876025.1 hypothetical protein H310_11221 [Aphanomyces invadans]